MASSDIAPGYEGILPKYCYGWLKAISRKLRDKVVELANKTKKLGKDDPRRIVHSLKVGLALTLVSLFYYFEPLYDSSGASSIWAIITVVVVFEFSVGATLGKGLNRAMATLVAGALGFAAHYMASLSGKKGQPILLGTFVYIMSAIATFSRFFPKIKARYDYGLLIFILTFSMVTVSGYRDDEILKLAWHRLINVLIGCVIPVFICIFVRPVWAGADLHHLVANNVANLGTFSEGFGLQYFGVSQGESIGANMQKYRSILTSKQTEESLKNQASWEPRHGMFRFRHPWKQYLKIGSLMRECAYRFEILNGYLKTDRIQIPLEIQSQFQEECLEVSSASGRALKELALAIRNMASPTSANSHIERAKNTTEKLKSLLTTMAHFEGIEIAEATTFISLLIDSSSWVEKIAGSVHQLVSLAQSKTAEGQSSVAPAEQPHSVDEGSSQAFPGSIVMAHHVIPINQTQSV